MLLYALALAPSIILLIWLLRIKRNSPYQKGIVAGMFAGGAACAVIVGIVFWTIDYIPVIWAVGSERFFELFLSEDPTELESLQNELSLFGGYMTLPSILWENFISTAAAEEIAKYLVAVFFIKRIDAKYTVFDAVVCSSITAVGFQLIEDLMYLDGTLVTAVVRGITPFHFTYGAIMGFFIGRAIATGNKQYRLKALLIPILIHGIYDFSIYLVDAGDWFILLFFVIYGLLAALTVYIITRIHRMGRRCS